MTDLDLPTIFAALSHASRLRILQVLSTALEPLATSLISELAGGLQQHVASKHLQVLLRAGLVTRTESGRYALYELSGEPFVELRQFLDPFSKKVSVYQNAESIGTQPIKHPDTSVGSAG